MSRRTALPKRVPDNWHGDYWQAWQAGRKYGWAEAVYTSWLYRLRARWFW